MSGGRRFSRVTALLVVLGGLTASAAAPAAQPPSATVLCDAATTTTPCPSTTTPPTTTQTTTTTTPTSTPALAPAKPPPVDKLLSNETTFTTWAWMLNASPVHRTPSATAPRVGTLHANTEDGFPEVYIVLSERTVANRLWAEVRLPMKKVNVTGWVPRSALDSYNRITTELVLNRASERIRLYRDGRQILSIPAGIGTSSTPTPVGHFWIREEFPVNGVSAYGPFAFGTSAYGNVTDWPGGGVVGLHGTDEPQLIPGRPSHGCIRVRNADILRLSRLVPVGTPLLVT